jgi:hypothetical protein
MVGGHHPAGVGKANVEPAFSGMFVFTSDLISALAGFQEWLTSYLLLA